MRATLLVLVWAVIGVAVCCSSSEQNPAGGNTEAGSSGALGDAGNPGTESGGSQDGAAGDGQAGGGALAASGSPAGGSEAASAGASGDAGGVGSGCLCGEPGCASCPLEPTVEISVEGGEPYEIDSSEVTAAQYAAFLADTAGVTDGQIAACAWNDSFEPQTTGICGGFYDPAENPSLPVVCVDWCDAVSYCSWAGKRLCGRIGGGSVAIDESDDPALDQWHRACTAAGTKQYPYGDTYEPSSCVAADYDGTPGYAAASDRAQPVTSAAACVGGYPGLYDMSGNVGEWEDHCKPEPQGNGQICLARGGAFRWDDATGYLACGQYYSPEATRSTFIGLRCCSL